ncbi:Flavin-dependent oxidoreductase, luciferase family (includes alkanesulfonate monooxygenase SsuD and methylene tetrahydromethanopterin reductase) [Quadrisphaera granulorum]|uniref:Alkanesulfonate monooxygenase SsuD/methylene tetrahydromethanopterin reductase-like flavin-dependent oxidoreductase (Luciferase family) n=1 Tax=Quadrisphaera granulorum TaxID=317664 RepID=A0A316ABB7_9ACTN|nr:LLM class flavin-dependent oxidoreductase [Quadrisphaera granulorum]PWJ47117.1 alkanesulfonate monooxygenase SsuD/methylene tetrahydromethanopterin reductase-like flavin-dependent oxidoreductase (luciferase family) [Quadrisphaera granulorum]SZE98921.1 Flavin-dependent oxidoreductase, luciferase family (includes alkanesulfonate monooxygenase SsuD and methylene tetrahydromethanopterin reductase) [Quadrisphaera granulorum]
MPHQGEPLRRLGFLTIGTFAEDDPGPGHEEVLGVIELGERLGFDSAWLRHRHLQPGISSPVAVLAAATQRTTRIELGTAVTPLGWENPLRLAEDWATVDVLSGGRLNPGFSTGTPMRFGDVRDALYPDTADVEDFTQRRGERLLALLRGEPAGTRGTQGIEVFSDRVQPHSPGLAARTWCGVGSTGSARWAGEQGLNLLLSSVVRAEDGVGQRPGSAPDDDHAWDFGVVQAAHVEAYRAAWGEREGRGRISQGLVAIPTDSATPSQVEKYRAYAASRDARTARPQGPGRLLFERDLVGSSAQIAERLWEHAGFRAVNEAVFALPFTFEAADYEQILTDLAGSLGPALGWSPSSS